MRHTLLPAALLFAAALTFAPAGVQAADVDAVRTEQVRARLAKLSTAEKQQLAEAAAKIAADKSAALNVRVGAIRSIGLLQEASSVAFLRTLFTDAAVADEARAAIQRIPGPDSVSALIAGLALVKDPVLVSGFLEGLGSLRAASAVLTIKGFIGAPAPASEAAQRALAAIATPDAFEALKGAPESDLKRDLLLDAAAKILVCPKCDAATRANVLATLRAISSGQDKEAAFSAHLLRLRFQDADAATALNSASVEERRAATVFLQNSRDTESAKVLVASLEKASGDDLVSIAGAIAAQGLKNAVPAIKARVAKEDSTFVKGQLIKTLGQVGGAGDVAYLAGLLKAKDPVADAAKAALMGIRGQGVTDAFVALISDVNITRDNRLELLKIVRSRELRDAVPGLLSLLTDPEEDIRFGVLKIVDAFAIKAQLPLLKAAKTTPDTAERLASKIKKLEESK
ncbi:MAG: hypothetical protein LBG65_06875 [Puniceicoccales bacterium]|jgi:hypothetical protein|nr:hypothetical protein [Puniceicoccales bacterium]